MKPRWIFVTVFVAFQTCAFAEWREIARNQDLALFQDAAADRLQGAIIYTREMQHFLVETSLFGMKVGSKVLARAYDCGGRTRRTVRSELFEAGMAEGKPFDWSEMPDAPWQPVANEPLGEEGLHAACQRAAPAK
jgi:hypothetical protein